LADCLADIEITLGDRPIAVARELTKLHEEIYRGTVAGAREHFAGRVRGEVTLVLGGATRASATTAAWDEERIRRALQAALNAGVDRKEASRRVAQESGWPRREVYRLATELT
jgi:16S rRNA (cytidine1402-2'-O)-methyltransferase